MAARSEIWNPIFHPILFAYQVLQWLIAKIFSPDPPDPSRRPPKSRPRIAVIGAGVTGVTSAAHCVGHGFDVVLFEAGTKDNLGGIWSRVNSTSGLQIHSLMYRFHPSVQWQKGYPNQAQIVSQVRQLWERYGLEPKTVFETKVDRVFQDDLGRWIVNDARHGRFEGVIAAIGTCGEPKMPEMPGMDAFAGEVYHSSALSGTNARGKKMIIVGGGASAVEALEFAAKKEAAKVSVLARSDKWIIPRNPLVDMALALNIFGHETVLSWIPELVLRKLFYRDLEDMAPAPEQAGGKGLFEDTPMVNSDVMDRLRSGKAEWLRCDVERFVEKGVVVNRRERGVKAGGPGREEVIEGDIVVMATGFERPKLDILPDDCFEKPYGPPNWYLQTFPPNHPSISAINCTYMNAIGTVGNWHIGIYTRILLMFLVDPLTRPATFWMERWIDMTRLLKATSPTGAFDFFTYLELVWWFVFCISFNPFRWKWAFFVFFGFGFVLPNDVVRVEGRVRDRLGLGLVNGDHEEYTDVGMSI